MSDREEGKVDLREVWKALRRGWVILVLGTVAGGVLGAVAARLIPQQYEGAAKVLVRSAPDLASSALAGLGGVGEMIGGLGGGGLSSQLSTELEIMGSRTVIGEVVDSLMLQAVVVTPEGVAPAALFSRAYLSAGQEPRSYTFDREGEGYRIAGPGINQVVPLGSTIDLTLGELTLGTGELPSSFEILLLDREDAIENVQKGLRTSSLTNDVAEILYRSNDPYTAAEVPNLLITEYLRRRQTTDRGTNQHRLEFLVEHTDSVTLELARAEMELRQYQEVSGVLDPKFSGETQLTRAMELQGDLEEIDVEARALQRIVDADREGRLGPRELAAFPSFLQNAAINDVLSRLLEFETERVDLLQRRTAQDDDVIALTQSISHLEGQLRSLSVAYLGGLAQQRAAIVAELAQYRNVLDQLPAQAEQSFRRQREVERLTGIQLLLHSQLVQARLAAIGEGGDVQQIDAAVPPKKPAFPSNEFVIALGLFGGLFFGTVGAVGSGLVRRRISEAWEAELATGVPAFSLASPEPLSFPEMRSVRSILLIPAGRVDGVLEVAERIVETATLQGREAGLLDLWSEGRLEEGRSRRRRGAAPRPSRTPIDSDERQGGTAVAIRQVANLTTLQEQFPFVVVATGGVSHPHTLALIEPDRPIVLVAGAGVIRAEELRRTVQSVERLGGAVVGVVLTAKANGGARTPHA